jgi:threonine synthase
MQYYSLAHISPDVDFMTAARQGQAPDRGLYFPEHLPAMPSSFVDQLDSLSLFDIAQRVMEPFTEGAIPPEALKQILGSALSFNIPLVELSEDLFVLELFHGPTLAFKDVGARFMSRCMGYFNDAGGAVVSGDQGVVVGGGHGAGISSRGEDLRPLTVLVATSGDTGGAVASGFDGVQGVKVVILYPKGKVSPVQELQLTTCSDNVTALEIEGTFDDCQRMVKEAFVHEALQKHLRLTSANSINIARWLPQQIYYWWAMRQWTKDIDPVFVVPSGNFGNICAGLLAYHMGMPAQHFLAACNANDTIPRYFQTGKMEPHPAVATLSNAMDVAVPSNFGRILEMFEKKGSSVSQMVTSVSLNDQDTVKAIQELYKQYDYIADPHTAVGYAAWKHYRERHPGSKGILLSTAHPVKFEPTIEKVLHKKLSIPESIQDLYARPVRKTSMPPDVHALIEFLQGQG